MALELTERSELGWIVVVSGRRVTNTFSTWVDSTADSITPSRSLPPCTQPAFKTAFPPRSSSSLSSSFGAHFSLFLYRRDMEDADKRNNRLAAVLEASVPFLQVRHSLPFETTQNDDICVIRCLNSFFYTCTSLPHSVMQQGPTEGPHCCRPR